MAKPEQGKSKQNARYAEGGQCNGTRKIKSHPSTETELLKNTPPIPFKSIIRSSWYDTAPVAGVRCQRSTRDANSFSGLCWALFHRCTQCRAVFCAHLNNYTKSCVVHVICFYGLQRQAHTRAQTVATNLSTFITQIRASPWLCVHCTKITLTYR